MTQRSSHTRLPRGFAGALGLVAVVELLLACTEVHFKNFYTHDWSVSRQAARARTSNCGVLCFGDSLVKFGIVPQVLQARLGLPTYNLAVCGGQAPSSYFLLRRALEANARPEAVVVDFMPHLLDHGPPRNARQWPELLSLREFGELARATRNATFLTITAVSIVLPSVRARFEIRRAILNLVAGSHNEPQDPMVAYERNWKFNQGAQLNPKAPASARQARFNLYRWEDFHRPWSCHRVNAFFVERFLELAQAHGILVYWLMPPVRDDAQARREQLGVEPRYEAFVRMLQSEFSDLIVIDARCAGYGREVFRDPLHLDRDGALSYSAAVAEAIARSIPHRGERFQWVTLDQPPRSTVNVAIEDMNESRLAMRLAARRPLR
jgi:hypothetical protein